MRVENWKIQTQQRTARGRPKHQSQKKSGNLLETFKKKKKRYKKEEGKKRESDRDPVRSTRAEGG